jgi:hypothetical protein
LPKPWIGLASRLPATLIPVAPSGTSETLSSDTDLAQWAASRAVACSLFSVMVVS